VSPLPPATTGTQRSLGPRDPRRAALTSPVRACSCLRPRLRLRLRLRLSLSLCLCLCLCHHGGMTALLVIGSICAALAAAVHVYIFVLESVLWTRPATWRIFGLRSQADADVTRPLAYNQGFYNLFLAIGIATGLLLYGVTFAAGVALVLAATVSMVLAATVLITSSPTSVRPAAVQGVLPLLATVLIAVGLLV
jgi:putative membrane protein